MSETTMETTFLCDRGEHGTCPGKTLRTPCGCPCHDRRTPAQLLEDAQRAAADLLGEIAEDYEAMLVLRRKAPELAKDVERVHKAWKAAGETFLRSLHEKGAN